MFIKNVGNFTKYTVQNLAQFLILKIFCFFDEFYHYIIFGENLFWVQRFIYLSLNNWTIYIDRWCLFIAAAFLFLDEWGKNIDKRSLIVNILIEELIRFPYLFSFYLTFLCHIFFNNKSSKRYCFTKKFN